MNLENLVLIDTCVWVSFLSGSNSREKDAVTTLLRNGSASVVGPVEFEVLVGIRRKKESEWVASRLKNLPRPEISEIDLRQAARLGAELTGQGFKLPMTDLVLSCLAIRLGISIYTTDPHFDLISGLKLFRP